MIHGERASDHPKVFTRIVVEHVVHGRNLSAESVRRAVELSATRYCSAAAMLGRVARIEESYRVVEDAPDRELKRGDVPSPARDLSSVIRPNVLRSRGESIRPAWMKTESPSSGDEDQFAPGGEAAPRR